MQIFFPILEISPKKCVAHLKLYLFCSCMNARDFCEVSANTLIRHKCFCWKLACYTVLQSLQIFIPQQLLQREMLFIIVVALRRSDIFQAEYCSSTVQQSLVFKILNADLQLQADFAISHLYNTNADYSPDSNCSATQFRN